MLFVAPAGNRSGVPIQLLHLTRWLLKSTDYQLAAVVFGDGPMVAELAAAMPIELFEPPEPAAGRAVRWVRRRPVVARRRHAAGVSRCQALVGTWPPDIVYCASAAGAGILDRLGPYTCPVIIHVHELEYVLQRLSHQCGTDVVAAMARHATRYIACSRAVAANLIDRHGVAADRITVVHEFIPVNQLPFPSRVDRSQPDLSRLAGVGIAATATVIAAVGTVEWRKGSDLFVSLARLLPPTDAAGRPVHLVWVGGGQDRDMSEFRFDIETAGLGGRVHAVGPTGRTADWYPAFTVLAMLSREDPFPLVVLEAAATGLPAVCFADSGGVPEFVEADAGRVVPYLDLAAFAAALMELVNDEPLRLRLGRRAAEKVRARHDVSVAAPQVVAVLDGVRVDAAGTP